MINANLIERLQNMGWRIATAESCSGGLLAAALTDIPGASSVFDCGIVSYGNDIKTRLLAVNEELLARHGAVSAEVARAMALGVLALSGAELALAVTGIAGPGGGSEEKPVGLVYIAAGSQKEIWLRRCYFVGGRDDVRRQTVEQALAMAEEFCAKHEERGTIS